MSIIKWDPFKELIEIQDQMNRMFNDSLTKNKKLKNEYINWEPNVDIFEDENQFILKIELPGISEKDTNISIDNSVLTIQGERKLENEDKKENYHRIERYYGSFKRQFTLPKTINIDKISAKSNNGILSITLPKKEEEKPKSININIE